MAVQMFEQNDVEWLASYFFEDFMVLDKKTQAKIKEKFGSEEEGMIFMFEELPRLKAFYEVKKGKKILNYTDIELATQIAERVREKLVKAGV